MGALAPKPNGRRVIRAIIVRLGSGRFHAKRITDDLLIGDRLFNGLGLSVIELMEPLYHRISQLIVLALSCHR